MIRWPGEFLLGYQLRGRDSVSSRRLFKGGPDFVGGEEVGVLGDEPLEVGDGGGDVREARWIGGGFDLGGDGFLLVVEAGEKSGRGG
ncbi:hypothetical protein Dsin_023988 [Dipteronia sinensis]|uniref:Uncharacterized protein n=1 Tax=Dipteronia sinensis TaxID=43782 RepID=A0AAE0E1A6_9ROSI|nr:hypothetical protein Dsin_023988 [Dipteronia sinensis]